MFHLYSGSYYYQPGMPTPKGSSAAGRRPGKRQARNHVMELAAATALLSVSALYLMSHGQQVSEWVGAAPAKQFRDFEPFYLQLYLKEHSRVENRYLHFLGSTLSLLFVLVEPRLLACIPPAIAVGLNVFYFTCHLRHGLLEMAAMLSTFLVAGRVLTGSWAKPAGPLLIGYFWAWLGHFLIEHNRPATFTYSTFSLMGDMRMWASTLTEIRNSIAAF